jgi:HD superfamily phosphohydrolase
MAGKRELFEGPTAGKPPSPSKVTSAERQPSTKADRQEFFLPVSGFIWFYPEEMLVIDHPAFQRLSRINQLGQAHTVYRGATHKRIEHVLGVVGVAQKMISALDNTAAKGLRSTNPLYAPRLSDSEKRFVRLGALLHDIGHLAAGHTLEDELGLVGKHDADKRLSLIFSLTEWEDIQAPSLSSLIDAQFGNYVPPALRKASFTATDIVRLLIRKIPDEGQDQFAEKHRQLLSSPEIRHHVCSNMIGNTICADILDYLYRDWYRQRAIPR